MLGEGWEKGSLGSLDGHVHTAAFKMDNQQGPSVQHVGIAQSYVAAWMGVMDTCVCVWLSPSVCLIVHLRLSQHPDWLYPNTS